MENQEKNNQENELSRRKFLHQSALAGTGAMVAMIPGSRLFAQPMQKKAGNITTRGYAARDKSGFLSPWDFERRPVGDHDVLLDIRYCGVCHSDIHTVRSQWRKQTYPLVPGHEIAGIVTAVGKNVTRFKVGDHAGVGCMVDSCGTCENCRKGLEQYCNNPGSLFTYGRPDKEGSPSGTTQGGYSTKIVVKDRFVIRIPDSYDLKYAAPLLCAGVTTFEPMLDFHVEKGTRFGVAGIGGLGHVAVKLAVSRGAEVYAFTTSPSKIADIRNWGVKEAILVDSPDKLLPYTGKLDYMVSTIPDAYDLGAYANMVKPYGHYSQIGMPAVPLSFSETTSFARNRVFLNGTLIGGIPHTQEVIDYCAAHRIYPEIQVIAARELNEVYEKVIHKQARYRYVIDIATV